MIEGYLQISEKIEIAIRSGLGYSAGDKVYFGTLRKQVSGYQFSVVQMQPVSREFAGARTVRVTFDFLIEFRFRRNEAPDDDQERFKTEKASAVIQQLAPYSVDDTIPSAGVMAGVAMKPEVYEFIPVPESDGDNFIAFQLRFRCMKDVLQ